MDGFKALWNGVKEMIKSLWKGVKARWDAFWVGDEYDSSKKHLSQSDKRCILYGNFIISIFTVALVLLVNGFNNLRFNRQNEMAMEAVMEMAKSYIASATEDEYSRIARTIRQDLVFRDYSKGLLEYAQHIPNASGKCHACNEDSTSQVALVSLNTGESYSLDLFGQRENSEDGQGNVQVMFGYDEISQASIRMAKSPGRGEGSAKIERGSGIVSLHRMKSLFCDECIGRILEAVEGKEMEELVILDTEKTVFYPLKNGDKVLVGDYALEIEYQDGDCEIKISFASKEG